MAATLGIDTKQQILEGTFAYLVDCGLENFRIKDLVNQISITEGTIYYWYKNKVELVCSAAEYGLEKMSDDIFDYFFNNIYDVDHFFKNCIKSINYVKNDLRFIYQMVASPVYGERLRRSSNKFIYAYDEYAERLAKKTGGDINIIKPIIYIFAACVIDYVLWQDEDEVQIQLDYICGQLKQAIGQSE